MSRELKDLVYGEFAQFGKALASPGRLEILDLLCQGPKTVDEIAHATTLSYANTSQHLKIIKESRLVKSERIGAHVQYSIADREVALFLVNFRNLATRQLAEVERAIAVLHKSGDELLPQMSARELSALVRCERTLLLDVRPAEEYAAGHLPGARSIPWNEVERRFSELSRKKSIVAYCRGPYCEMALKAVRTLRAHGYTAGAVPIGVSEWLALGGKVVVKKAA